MPLEILLVLVVVGIVGIALLTHLSGRSISRRLSTPSDALAAWEREFPADPAWFATLAAGGHSALVEAQSGPGIVWVMGLDTTARPLAGARVQQTADGLDVRFPDFGAPRLRVHLDETSDISAWSAILTEETGSLPA
ncbi:hypothetical protein CLV78_103169 [Aliiruegeria haliotis]|uniref:Uncharacterized protein n=1 Tax=Aliiruegeria haliotis TaxID=1280846 RepID=A0A2T0RT94_9RHOB|nr:hypothetical protein [Aliiruegeria haliotis]PRY24303.1 hypothetical protein CLV78_103169 [Aliiruegeria haliotis]